MNKNAAKKALIVAILYTIPILFILKNLLFATEPLKFWIGILVVLAWFMEILIKNYQRYQWEETLNRYVKKYQLTPEKLAKLTNRSIHDFYEGKAGEIKVLAKNQKMRLEILTALQKVYGPLI